ncbi:MAG TPA: hypothetical protein VD710_10310 [Nitrososphaeraceae archaeon]|nr:hypothetical protein [Nitrososphaeraceae archaeon]
MVFTLKKVLIINRKKSDEFNTNSQIDLEKINEKHRGKKSRDSTDASNASRESSDINREYPPKCYRCDFKPNNKQGYDNHCQREHPNLAAYPNKPSIDAYRLKPEGMPWE